MSRNGNTATDTGALFRWRPGVADSDGAVSSLAKPSLDARETWRSAIRAQLAQLTDLGANWDTYGASAVKSQTVLFAFQVLDGIWHGGLPTPVVMPTSSESVSVEWVSGAFDFSIEIRAPYDGSYYFEDAEGAQREGDFRENLADLNELAKSIGARLSNVAAAA